MRNIVRNTGITRRDLLASVFVIPVSLMFALGLSVVTHAPIESGIIAVVIGGLITGIFGGSYINISGPGIHSAAVWMMGSLILGEGKFSNGYQLMLSSGVIVGLLLILVGALRQIHRLDIIPISVRRGIVSMLGIWIMISQFPSLLGGDAYESYNSLGDMISTYPNLLRNAVMGESAYWLSGVGLVALMFMIFYSSYQNRFIRTLPAPLWLLIGGIAVSLYITVSEGENFTSYKNQLVFISDFGKDWLHSPHWDTVGTLKFWAVTLGFFMVTLNESVSNLRITDSLDVVQRRSDINKEISALGLATLLSCSIGGLNVSATVAQSSTNAQLKAHTRWSGVLSAIMLLVIVIFLTPWLEQLLIPILSAMMLYIGYRMAAPSHLRSIAEIGWEDFVAFAVTFFMAWQYGIVYGLLTGVLIIFILQLIVSGKPGFILRYAFRPNTLLYEEENSRYLLSIKHYGSYINLGRIREQIDSVPSSSEMVVDFSLAKFVDQNVLIHLEYYEEIFTRRGGQFEIVGVDDLPIKVHHPFAPWMPFGSAPSEEGPLSGRQEALAEWAKENAYTFRPEAWYSGHPFYAFQYFRVVRIEGQRNRISGKLNGLNFTLADIDYHEGEFIARGNTHSTMIYMKSEKKLPQFVLDKERLLDKVAAFAGFSDINFDNHPKFSAEHRLQGMNEKAIRDFFTDDLISLIERSEDYHIEARGNQIMIFEKERLATTNEIKDMVSFAAELAAFLKITEE